MTSTATPTSVRAGSIVVGVDGSACAEKALDWAVTQADLEHRPLAVAHAAHLNTTREGMWMGQAGVDVSALLEDVRTAGNVILDEAVARAARRAPGLEAQRVLGTTDPRDLLMVLAESAAVLVVGSRGRGPIARLLLGSVSVAVAKHATCPVVVIRHDDDAAHGGGVLVGVDGTAGCLPAIEFAYRTASIRSLPLTAMHVFWDSARPVDEGPVSDAATGFEAQRLLLAESVAGMGEKFPDVEEHLVVARGLREHQLVAASSGMDLVVVGSPSRGFVERLVNGSVAPIVVENAACDVVVVPAGTEKAP